MSENPALPAHEKDWPALFLIGLAEFGNVTDAAKFASVNRDTPYDRRAKDPAFAAAWKIAEAEGTDALEAEARRRALGGTEKPVFYKGKECGRVREYSDTLLIVLLKAHRPEKFRERTAVDHGGEIKVRVEYADLDHVDAPEAPPRSEDGPAE